MNTEKLSHDLIFQCFCCHYKAHDWNSNRLSNWIRWY